MITNLFVPEKPCQHGQGMICERLVDEWLLPFKRLDRATGREIVILVELWFDDLRKQFRHCWQPARSPAVPTVFRLAQNKLAAISHIPDIQPVGRLLEERRADDLKTCRTRVHAGNENVHLAL